MLGALTSLRELHQILERNPGRTAGAGIARLVQACLDSSTMAHNPGLVELPCAAPWWKAHAPSFLGLHFQGRPCLLSARTTLRQALIRLICVQP